MNLKPKLWTRDFTLLISATVLGAAGGIAGSFALSFLVYEETGSTLAAALLIAINVIPGFIVPVVAAPFMDRLPRKPFLVGGDAVDGALYAAAGLYLLGHDFTYVGYLFFSLLLSSLSAFDSLAYQSIFPKLIPEGAEERGYTVSSMVYPVMQVVMAPAAAWLMEAVGVAAILIGQGALSLLAAAIESRISVREERRLDAEGFSLRRWLGDLRDAAAYLKKERGPGALFALFRSRVRGPQHRRRGALQAGDTAREALEIRLSSLQRLRAPGRGAALAALPAHALEPGRGGLSRHRQRDDAPRRRAELYPRRDEGEDKRL